MPIDKEELFKSMRFSKIKCHNKLCKLQDSVTLKCVNPTGIHSKVLDTLLSVAKKSEWIYITVFKEYS
jgi:hypothetical protein